MLPRTPHPKRIPASSCVRGRLQPREASSCARSPGPRSVGRLRPERLVAVGEFGAAQACPYDHGPRVSPHLAIPAKRGHTGARRSARLMRRDFWTGHPCPGEPSPSAQHPSRVDGNASRADGRAATPGLRYQLPALLAGQRAPHVGGAGGHPSPRVKAGIHARPENPSMRWSVSSPSASKAIVSHDREPVKPQVGGLTGPRSRESAPL